MNGSVSRGGESSTWTHRYAGTCLHNYYKPCSKTHRGVEVLAQIGQLKQERGGARLWFGAPPRGAVPWVVGPPLTIPAVERRTNLIAVVVGERLVPCRRVVLRCCGHWEGMPHHHRARNPRAEGLRSARTHVRACLATVFAIKLEASQKWCSCVT